MTAGTSAHVAANAGREEAPQTVAPTTGDRQATPARAERGGNAGMGLVVSAAMADGMIDEVGGTATGGTITGPSVGQSPRQCFRDGV